VAEVTKLSKDERDKMAAYKQAMKDRRKVDATSAKAALPDGGMIEGGEMPADRMSADRPMTSEAMDTALGAMPKSGMHKHVEAPSMAGGEMPRPPMS